MILLASLTYTKINQNKPDNNLKFELNENGNKPVYEMKGIASHVLLWVRLLCSLRTMKSYHFTTPLFPSFCPPGFVLFPPVKPTTVPEFTIANGTVKITKPSVTEKSVQEERERLMKGGGRHNYWLATDSFSDIHPCISFRRHGDTRRGDRRGRGGGGRHWLCSTSPQFCMSTI